METTTKATVEQSHRVSIIAKYLATTNHKGTRISVQRGDGDNGKSTRLIVSWDYALDTQENYAEAIRQYVERMGWGGTWVTGATQTGAVAVWVSDNTPQEEN